MLAPPGNCNGEAQFSSCGNSSGCDIAWDSLGRTYVSATFCGSRFNGTVPGVARLETDGGLTQIVGYGGGGLGENVPATTTPLSDQAAIAFDAQGRLLLLYGNQLRAIDMNSGLISSVGGSSSPGTAGQYAPVSSARFDDPYDLLPLPGGHVLIVDSYNHALRMVW